MPKRRKWTDQNLRLAVQESTSIRMVLIKLGLIPAGGNYRHITQKIHELNLDCSHFLGKAWNKNWIFDPRIKPLSLNEILVNGKNYQSHKLRIKLIKSGIKRPKCEMCGWNKLSIDGRLPLELDHINGIHSDNRLENLRVLCPNCHSLQTTHRGKNRKMR